MGVKGEVDFIQVQIFSEFYFTRCRYKQSISNFWERSAEKGRREFRRQGKILKVAFFYYKIMI